MLSSLVAAAVLVLARPPVGPPCVAGMDPGARSLPVDYMDGRYFVRWSLKGGDTLRMYLDTGGPRDHLTAGAVQRLGLIREVKQLGPDSVSWVRLPAAIATQLVPSLRSNNYLEDSTRTWPPESARLMAYFPKEDGFGSERDRVDGILGPDWFGGRVWTLDYAGRKLWYHENGATTSVPAACWVPLGFQLDSAGRRSSNFPRITAVVDGDSVDFLLDTGAMTVLSDAARRATNQPTGKIVAASFIIHSRFERWRAGHPDWLVVENADIRYHNRMIRVPSIEVGGQRQGPVWFSERPDAAFHNFMSQWMDRQIDGALGGSAWRDVVVVLDYPGARAAILTAPAR
ncbi:MAG: hypothetical protein ABJC74_02205 [Gemmatimonadota bacterium]